MTYFNILPNTVVIQRCLSGECLGDACSDVQCLHGGKCVSGGAPEATTPSTVGAEAAEGAVPMCLCPLGYSGQMCETQINLEVSNRKSSRI